jgi:hypothetical protein
MMGLSYFKAVIGYAMQLCGARGAGQAAVRSLYWVANKGLSLMLVLESERERNAAILLARRFASNQNVSFVLLFFKKHHALFLLSDYRLPNQILVYELSAKIILLVSSSLV